MGSREEGGQALGEVGKREAALRVDTTYLLSQY